MPRFPGCENEAKNNRESCANQKMLEFIYKNQEYPAVARKNKIEGTTVVQFVIDQKGNLTSLKSCQRR